jgi:predicted DNA-binding antitoxin AbrB/MazE fold protein
LLVFIGNVLSEGNKVQILITKEINSAILSTDFYDGLKEYYKKNEKQNEKIALKRI